jgi:NAD(P)-dependent dehydrogenase (short-subunit alcohol dehydrogenase family)
VISNNGTGSIGAPTQLSMRGKTVVITGASSGIGLAAAEALATEGAELVLVCRNPERAKDAKAQVARAAGGTRPRVVIADLADQAQIRMAADGLRASLDHVDVLINNAGAIFAKRELTVDGIEKTFAVNHLAPFLLTNLLTDLLAAADAARVVAVVSEIYSKKIDFDNLQGERSYQFFRAYQASKLANILFTTEFAQQVAGTKITANSVSPGPSVTRFGDDLTGMAALMPKVMKRIPFLFKSPEEAAKGVVRLASDPALQGVTAKFFMRLEEETLKPVATDPENARRLWDESAKLVGLPTKARLASPGEAVSA